MIKNVLLNNKLSLRQKTKNILLYISRVRGAKRSWKKRHNKVLAMNKDYEKPCNPQIEKEHINLWSQFRRYPDLTTLRVTKNISGISDPRIIPEDIFVSDIEPSLIDDESAHLMSHKSLYNLWFPGGVFPKDFFHRINNQYLDSNLNPISFSELKKKAGGISYPVVIKPNWNSYGGKDVHFVENDEQLIRHCQKEKNFVIQEQIIQHEFFNKYNPVGLNTIRVYVYRSVKDNATYVLSMALRMGKGGSLDNSSSGGIYSMIRQNGRLNNYAVDKYGKKYSKHPDTGYGFDEKIPELNELKKLAERIGRQIFFTRIIGLDMCYDKDGAWRAIEVNTKGHTIRFSQYGGQPFLGEFTDEVIDYCKNNHWALK